MKIGIYVEVARGDKPTGIGLHVRNLVDALAELDTENEYYLYFPAGMRSGAATFGFKPLPTNFRLRPVRFPKSWPTEHPSLWWKWYLPRILRWDRIDVFHGPNHYLPRYSHGRNVVTIHDLAYFKMQLYEQGFNAALQQWTKNALEWAEAVIALSENTRKDIDTLGIASDRIHVIYGGGQIIPDDQICYDRSDELRTRFQLPEKYILFVGSLVARKNVPFLLRAFAHVKKQSKIPHRLVLAGARDTASNEVDALIHELNLASEVTVTGYVENWELPLLYKMADLFVLPTLYEGFTLVTLEAMAYGVPVIATDTSSIREGVGDAACLVEVNNVEALSNAINDVVGDNKLRESLISHGKERAKMFTWKQCAQRTLDLYRKVSSKTVH